MRKREATVLKPPACEGPSLLGGDALDRDARNHRETPSKGERVGPWGV
jgi:hypothetical protein